MRIHMKWLVIVLITLFLFILLIIFTKITVIINYYHGQDNDNLSFKIKIWFGLISYKKTIPIIKIADNSPSIVYKEKSQTNMGTKAADEGDKKKFSVQDLINSLHDVKEMLKHVISLHKIIRIFLKKVSLKKLEWHSVVGIGDAALTGTLIGALWSVKGGLLGLISAYVKLKEMPNISITPSFQRLYSQTKLACMFQFRIGHAMVAGLKLVKYWKGGKPSFKTKQLSFLSKEKSKTV